MDKALELINSLNLELSSNQKAHEKKLPEFPGGISAWNQYLVKSIKVGAYIRDQRAEKKVFIEFTVDKNGRVGDVKLIQGSDQKFNEESLRVIRSSPKWIPGQIEGKPIPVKMIVPVVLKFG